jgi:hypothetical protein
LPALIDQAVIEKILQTFRRNTPQCWAGLEEVVEDEFESFRGGYSTGDGELPQSRHAGRGYFLSLSLSTGGIR